MVTIDTMNPATAEVIGSFQQDDATSISAKFQRASQAQNRWAQVSLNDRNEKIARFATLLKANLDECALDLTRETGKPLSQAKGEIKATQSRLNFFLEQTPAVLQPRKLAGYESGTSEEIHYEPLGTVANISAWNYPYFVGSNVIIPALLTGNTVLYKPSEFALHSGHHMTRLLHEAGIPDDVFQMVIGDGHAGAALLEQNINGVFFTGSYQTGKSIAETLAGRMIKLQLELGGKDPSYICEDVDVASVAKNIVEGCFYNAGQSCCAIERVYVANAIYDSFCKAFAEEAQKWLPGNPEEKTTRLGPLTRAVQMDVLDAQFEDAVAKGARVLLDGGRSAGPGSFYRPIVLADTNHSMSVMRDESFGPIIGIQSVAHDHEALGLMQDTAYGLTASVFTEDEERAERMLSQINSGTVYWNCSDRVSPQLPWSGRGHSGIGLTCSVAGIETFVQPKAWHRRRS